jgi:proteasome assembly chaperone (PAC2) family protein
MIQFLSAYTTPEATDAVNLLGDATAGSETGIYEFVNIVQVGAAVGALVVLSMVGFMLFKKVAKKAT